MREPPNDEPPPPEAPPRRALPLLLFVATVVSVLHVGGDPPEGATEWQRLASGWSFAVPLVAILLAHEFGHYFAARLHRVPTSLPYFLPMPLSPLGTWGAVIGMPQRIASRRALLDIGAAGPLAGLCVALPVLFFGLTLSEVKPLTSPSILEGQCLLYLGIKRWALGQAIPDGHDVFLHPTAFAGWAGLFVTMINLVPFGQLDGGHVAYALLGPRQNTIARWVHAALLPLFALNLAKNLLAAHRVGLHAEAVKLALSNSLFWLMWFGLLLWMRRVSGPDHPPTDPGEPLGPARTAIAVACLVLFFLLFMPAPFTQT